MLQETALRLVDGLLTFNQGGAQVAGGVAVEAAANPNLDKILTIASFALWDQKILMDSAVELLDSIKANQTTIRCYASQGPGGRRKCWRMPGSDKGTEYTCMLHYCPCPMYTDMAGRVAEGRTVMCKHLVAIRIATALGIVSESVLGDEQFVAKMCETPVVSAGRAGARMLHW